MDTLKSHARFHCEASRKKLMSGDLVKARSRSAKKNPREQNPKKGSGVCGANFLVNGYGLLIGIKPWSGGR
jgi:hypothetical protein